VKPLKAGLDIGLIVSDLPAMRSFYESTLGMEVRAERTTGWGEMVELGFADSVLRLLRPPEAPAPAPTGMTAALGIRYVTFEVADFDDTVAALRAASAPVEVDVLPIRDIRIAMFRDPEGNVIELLAR
jgi:catechol 2,3-dioxygenase-like lactoylglutathione lyase family enzyme